MPIAPVPERLLDGKVQRHVSHHPGLLNSPRDRRQHAFSGARIGSHQASRPQLDATKIADHDHQYVAHILVLDHVQDGFSGGARGLAVIVHGSLGGRPGAAYLIGPAHMPGIGEILVGLCHQGSDLFPAVNRIHPGNKPALPDLGFPFQVLCRHRIIFTHDPLRPGNTIVSLKPPSGWLTAVMVPPCLRMMSRAMASPSPQPAPPRDWSARKKGSNSCSRISSSTPGPSSVTSS